MGPQLAPKAQQSQCERLCSRIHTMDNEKALCQKCFSGRRLGYAGRSVSLLSWVQKIQDLKFSRTACCETGKPSVTSLAKSPDYRRFPTARDRSRAATAFRPVDSFRWLGTLKIGNGFDSRQGPTTSNRTVACRREDLKTTDDRRFSTERA